MSGDTSREPDFEYLDGVQELLDILEVRPSRLPPFDDTFRGRLKSSDLRLPERQAPEFTFNTEPQWGKSRHSDEAKPEPKKNTFQSDRPDSDDEGDYRQLSPHRISRDKDPKWDAFSQDRSSIDISVDPASMRSMTGAIVTIAGPLTKLAADRLVNLGVRDVPQRQKPERLTDLPQDVKGAIRLASGLPDGPLIPLGISDASKRALELASTKKPQLMSSAVAAMAATIVLSGAPTTTNNTLPSRETYTRELHETSPKQTTVELSTQLVAYHTSRPTHIHAIARDIGASPETLIEANPGIDPKQEIPAGSVVNSPVVSSKLKLDAPVTVAEVAKSFGLSDDAVKSANHVQQNQIQGELIVPGRKLIVIEGCAQANIAALSAELKLSQKDARLLSHVNQAQLPGMLVLPTNLDTGPTEVTVETLRDIASLAEPITTDSDNTTSTTVTSEAPTTTQVASPETTTTTVATTTTTTAPAETKTITVLPEVDRLNGAMTKIQVSKRTNDLSELVAAVVALDHNFAPNDPDRRPDLPHGYVKMLLPNEAPGVIRLRTVAERTDGLERYTSAQGEAALRAISEAMEKLIASKYPQFAGSVLRLRDANSPNHATHNYGQMIDFSTERSLAITQYSNGPVADRQFSKNYSQAFTIDLLTFMAGLRIGDDPVIHRVISSNPEVVKAVNARTGSRFMSLDKDGEHDDHAHIILNPKYKLPKWGLRARDLPWSTEQDLWVGNRGRSISDQQHEAAHKRFETWMAAQMLNAVVAAPEAPATKVASPEVPTTPVKTQPIPVSDVPVEQQGQATESSSSVEPRSVLPKSKGIPPLIAAAIKPSKHFTAIELAAQLFRESSFNPNAHNSVAAGIAEFTEGTWEVIGRDDPNDPDHKADRYNVTEALDAQRRYMDGQYEVILRLIAEGRVHGDPKKLTFAAYNAGIGNVKKARGMPDIAETRNYVKNIEKTVNEYSLATIAENK